jgi:hypothetical protein
MGLRGSVFGGLQDYVSIMEFLMKHWKIGNVTGLQADGMKAQEDVQKLLIKFRRLTEMQVFHLAVLMCVAGMQSERLGC